jgi:transcriptional regulator NrdR family protein
VNKVLDRGEGDRDTALKCPKCGAGVRCFDSRPGPNNTIRRRRGCVERACAYRFTTYEVAAEQMPLSPKATGFLLQQLIEAHARMGERLQEIVEANKAAALLKSLEGPQ